MKKNIIILFFPKPSIIINAPRVPNALFFLERMIHELPVKVILIDQNIESNYENIIIEHSEKILLAGISSMTGHQIHEGIEFSKKIRQFSSAKILWGGWHTTLLPEQVLEKDYIDFIIQGQGEVPFVNLIKSLIYETDLTKIESLGYKKDGKLTINPMSGFLDPTTFPPIDYKNIDLSPYIYKSKFADRTFEFFVSYGCPFNCGFCSLTAIYNRKWYHGNIDQIISDLKYFQQDLGIEAIKFDDDNFFVNRSFTLELCNKIIESQIKIKWFTTAHAGHFLKLFSREDIDLMKKSGLVQIFIGAESGDQEILDKINKTTKVEENLNILKLLKQKKILAMFSVIFCFPYNPDKDFELTLKMLTKAKLIMPDLNLLAFFYIPFPGTDLFNESILYGFNPPETLEKWAEISSKNNNAPWRKPKHLNRIKIFINFYFNLIDPMLYKKASGFSKILIFSCTLLFYPITYLRFKTGFLKFPVEAIIFLSILKFFNKLFKTNLKLRPKGEDYLSL